MLDIGLTVRRLQVPDLSKAVDVYAAAFRFDGYFTQQFKTDDAYIDIKEYYMADIQNTIEFGIAWGLFNRKGNLVAAVFAINPIDWNNNHPDAYRSLFRSGEMETDAWCDYMIEHFQKMQKRVVYIYGLVVSPGKQCHGYGTKMLHHMVSTYGASHVIVGDPTDETTIKMWLREGFHKEYMGTVMVVVRD